jgi:hypothetical protein
LHFLVVGDLYWTEAETVRHFLRQRATIGYVATEARLNFRLIEAHPTVFAGWK